MGSWRLDLLGAQHVVGSSRWRLGAEHVVGWQQLDHAGVSFPGGSGKWQLESWPLGPLGEGRLVERAGLVGVHGIANVETPWKTIMRSRRSRTAVGEPGMTDVSAVVPQSSLPCERDAARRHSL